MKWWIQKLTWLWLSFHYVYIYQNITQPLVNSVSCSVVSNTLQHHGLQHARLLCLWDFPGKNTGVGYRFLLQGSSWPRDKPGSPSLQADSLLSEPPDKPQQFVLYYLSSLCPWNSPGKNARVGSCSLLQGIFPTQGLNAGLLPYRQILYNLSHQGILCTLNIYNFICHLYLNKAWERKWFTLKIYLM